jgi:hypothetical protein
MKLQRTIADQTHFRRLFPQLRQGQQQYREGNNNNNNTDRNDERQQR